MMAAIFRRCASALLAVSSLLYAGHALSAREQLLSRAEKGSRYYKQTLTNLVDLQYWGDLDIGNQVIQGILDTGSYELLVCSKDAKGCGKAAVYKHGQSTEVLDVYGFHFYGSGTTFSRMVTDTVAVTGAPSSAGLAQEEQYLWEILRTYMPVIEEGNFQAIVGLGPPEVPDDDAMANAEFVEEWYDSVDAGILTDGMAKSVAGNASAKADYLAEYPTLLESWDVRAFSVCLQRPYESPGYLVWNDEDTRASQPDLFRYVALSGDRTWGTRVTDASVGGTSLGCGKGCGAIVDSGTSLVMVDPETFDKMYNFLVDAQKAGDLATDCSNLDQLPDLVFKMDGGEFRLPPQSYVGTIGGVIPQPLRTYFPKAPASGEFAACEILLSPIDAKTEDGPLWIVGMPFFREYYTTFDLGDNPRDPKSRAIYTAPAGDNCNPTHYEDVVESTYVQSQRKAVRTVDLAKVRIPMWARTASKRGHMRM